MNKRNKKRKNLSKLTKELKPLKIRVPNPPVGEAFKSKRDYNRANNKNIIKKELDE